jgi:hypothetical protein
VDPTFVFDKATYVAMETAPTVTLKVLRVGEATGEVIVSYATTNGSATAPGDYKTKSGSLTYGPGITARTFRVAIVNDTAAEGIETFKATLANPSGTNASLGTPSQATVNVKDNDGSVFALAKTVYSVGEGAGRIAVVVQRSGNLAASATVRVRTVAASATAPADYAHLDTVLTFAPQAASKAVSVTIVNDAVGDPGESFKIQLLNPTNGTTLGTQRTATVLIADNE